MPNTTEFEALQDEFFSAGDARRCPRHGEVISSPDGLHDAPCSGCEYEADTGESAFTYDARLKTEMDRSAAEERARVAALPPPADDDILF